MTHSTAWGPRSFSPAVWRSELTNGHGRGEVSFKQFRDVFRFVQPKSLGRYFTLDQLFAISLDMLDENALFSIRLSKAREHESRALGTQETLGYDRHRRELPNPNLPEVRQGAR